MLLASSISLPSVYTCRTWMFCLLYALLWMHQLSVSSSGISPVFPPSSLEFWQMRLSENLRIFFCFCCAISTHGNGGKTNKPRNLSFQKFFLRGSSSNNYWIRIWLALVFSFNYEFFLSIMNLEIKKKVLVVFGLSYTDLHIFKMKRPIGRAKNQSFISISLVISSSTCMLSLNSPIPVELLWFFTLPSLIKWNHLGQMCLLPPLPIVKFHFSVPSHSFNQDFYIGVAQGWQNGGWDKRTCLFLFTCLFLSGLGDHCLRPSVKSFISSCLRFWLQSFFTPILQHNLPNQDFHQLILQWLPNASKGQCHRLTPAVQPPHTFQRLITHVSS